MEGDFIFFFCLCEFSTSDKNHFAREENLMTSQQTSFVLLFLSVSALCLCVSLLVSHFCAALCLSLCLCLSVGLRLDSADF
jgi:uncharacterized membrane protein